MQLVQERTEIDRKLSPQYLNDAVPTGNLRVRGDIIIKFTVNKYFVSVEWLLLAQNKEQRRLKWKILA